MARNFDRVYGGHDTGRMFRVSRPAEGALVIISGPGRTGAQRGSRRGVGGHVKSVEKWPPELSAHGTWAGDSGRTRPFTATKGQGHPFRPGGKNGGKSVAFQMCNSFIVIRLRNLGKQSAGIVGTGATLPGGTCASENRACRRADPGGKTGGSLPFTSALPRAARRIREYGRN